jgi:hypothetical protein
MCFIILDTHIIFRVDFNNFMAKQIEKRLMQGPQLPDVTSSTFFKVNLKTYFHIGSYLKTGNNISEDARVN